LFAFVMFEPKSGAKYKALVIIYDWILYFLKGKGINLLVKKLGNEYKDFWTLDVIKAIYIIGLN
jgi:hypothetical protein